ncbi:MAG: hypothetical protein ACFHX7_03600 [Pseudomonadota bacterium]
MAGKRGRSPLRRGLAKPLARLGLVLLLVVAQNLSLNHQHDWVADPFGVNCDVCLQFSHNSAITATPLIPTFAPPGAVDLLERTEAGFSGTPAVILIRGPPTLLI